MGEAFHLAASPRLVFGAGKISLLPSLLKTFGMRVLMVTGTRSFTSSPHSQSVIADLERNNFQYEIYSISGEPSPAVIDEAITRFASRKPDVVLGLGGGSVLDAGKAISAMLPIQDGVKSYLEGVGSKNHSGHKVPFVAVPTTAGTGSEATKNAVLSDPGPNGFKKSLRHDNFVPNAAVLDPVLTTTCPKDVTAASGMDAFTQLLESYLSPTANAITDTLALEGLARVARALTTVYHDGSNLQARADMALAAYLSGITLANAGLGAVHGLAGTIGGMYAIPHGVVCSALMEPANIVTLRKLRSKGDPTGALRKYARAGSIFCDMSGKTDAYYIDFLVDRISEWKTTMKIPTLAEVGLAAGAEQKIAAASDSKNNPVVLETAELEEVLALAIESKTS